MLVFGGTIYLATPELLCITDLTKYTDTERRGYVRVRIAGEGTVIQEQEPFGKEQVPVCSISLSGLLFESAHSYQVEDCIRVENLRLCEDMEPLSVLCRVKRLAPALGAVGYGCQFEGISPSLEDALYTMLHELQRRELYEKKRPV